MAVDMPLDEEEQRAYLAEHGVGLVAVAERRDVRLARQLDRPAAEPRRR